VKTLFAILTGTALLLCLWPWYHLSKERGDAARSLPSLKTAGECLHQYEVDYGTLPPAGRWVQNAKRYNKNIEDPTYRAITGEDQPNNPGWGMNARLDLTLGNPKQQNEQGVKSSQYPEDAILLMPGFSPVARPNRNGTIDPERLSTNNPRLTEHTKRIGSVFNRLGKSGLYLTTRGEILLLTPEKAAEKLRIRQLPESEEAARKEKIESAEAEPNWVTDSKVEKFKNHIVIQNGSVTTPFIPVSPDKNTAITLETTSDSPTKISIQVEFSNQFKYPINCGNETTAELKAHYAGTDEITTDKKLEGAFGFNPQENHASFSTTAIKSQETAPGIWLSKITPVPAHYKRGINVIPTKDTSLELQALATPQKWETTHIDIPAESLPTGTHFLTVTLSNPSDNKLLIKNIKVKKGESAPSP